MSYKKMKAIKGGSGGCLCCGYQHEILPMEALIAVGFGYAAVTKNDEEVYNENDIPQEVYDKAENYGDVFWSVQKAEDEAKKDPDNDWRIHLVAPLSERHYQRQGENHWVLYEKGLGFA
jgi:formate hydrogenlyase subunit 6/NADH:ubiquinone oxidoreductase subunit I